MNATRKKALGKLFEELEVIKSELDDLTGEERDQFEAMSEKRQESDAGQTVAAAASSLESALDSLDTALDSIMSAMGNE